MLDHCKMRRMPLLDLSAAYTQEHLPCYKKDCCWIQHGMQLPQRQGLAVGIQPLDLRRLARFLQPAQRRPVRQACWLLLVSHSPSHHAELPAKEG